MSKYSTLKAEIIASIKRNGAQAITGDLLQEKLLAMITSLGEFYQFGGLAIPSTEFTPGDEPVVFIAATPGTYTDFGGIVVADGEVALLIWNGSAWSKQTTDIATRSEVSQLGQDVDNLGIIPAGKIKLKSGYRFGNIIVDDSSWRTTDLIEYKFLISFLTENSIVLSRGVAAYNNAHSAVCKLQDGTYSYIDKTTGTKQFPISDFPEETEYVAFNFFFGGGSTEENIVSVNTSNNNDIYTKLVNDENNEKYNIVNSLKPLGVLSQSLYVNQNQDTELFTISDADIGNIVSYRINLTKSSSTITSVNGYIELLDSNNERLAIYGKTTLGDSHTIFEGQFEIPSGFARAVLKGSADGYLDYVVNKSKGINVLSITTNGSNLVLRVAELKPNTIYRVVLPEITSLPSNLQAVVLKVQNNDGSQIAFELTGVKYYNKPPYVDFSSGSLGGIAISILDAADVSHVCYIYEIPKSNEYKVLDEAQKKNSNDIVRAFNYIRDIGFGLKEDGYLAFSIQKYDEDSIELFTSSDVESGDTIHYKLSVDSRTIVGYNAYVELLDGNDERIAIYGKTSIAQTEQSYSGSFTIPTNFEKAVFRGTAISVVNYLMTEDSLVAFKLAMSDALADINSNISELQEAVTHISDVDNVTSINAVSFPELPITLISNTDQDATQYDNKIVNFATIVKVSDSMYYLYYTCKGINDGDDDADQHLCFAYSTDGFNYLRGFPQGITPPVAGTNLIFNYSVIEHDVKIVNDPEYPFRMVGNTIDGATHQIVTLFKSRDGVNFERIRALTDGGNDTQSAMIVRGNTLKIYVRQYGVPGRMIGILYCDLNGNLISPEVAAISYWNLQMQPYNSGASVLDDHRDILFPTKFYPNTNVEELSCMIVNGQKYSSITVDFSNVVGENKSMYVCPGLINIGLDMYMAVALRNTDHATTTGIISCIKLVKVNLSS